MDNVFQKMADKDNPQSQPQATPAQPQPAQSQPQPSGSGNVFEQMDQADKQQNPPDSTVSAAQGKSANDNSEAARELARKQAAGHHGILARAWDWVNQPIFDNVLPEGVKTADIIKGAAFEKMYNEAYIPGVNDFNTKAATHFEPAEKLQAGLGPKEKDGVIKKNIRKFLVDHASDIDATANAGNTFAAGATRDAVDMGAGFTSPLSLGTLGLGKAGRVGKVLAPLVGTAFGLQGMGQVGEGAKDLMRTTTWENLKHGYLDPDAVQKVLGGAGQAALAGTAAVHGAGDVVDFAKGKATPEIKTIGGQEVPVRAENATAQMVQKAVPDEVNQSAARQTGEAVKQGIGNVVKEATGSEADTNVSQTDRLGIRAHSEDLKTKATTAMDKLNELSDGMYNEARDMVDKNKTSPLPEGQDKATAGRQLMHDIEEQYRPDMEREGHNVDEMRGNYRKAIAMEKIAKKLEVATEAASGAPGEFDVNGKKLVKAIDDIRKVAGDESDPSHSKNWFHRAGIGEDHINALAELADTLRDQQETPKFGTLAKLGAKAIAIAAAGHGVGLGGALEAITGESLAEHIGSKAMGKLFGEALTDVDTAKQLNKALKGGPAAMSKWDKFKNEATRLWQEEHGEMEIPGTGKMGQIGKDVPVNAEPRQDMNPVRRENGDLEFNHPNGSSQMVLHPEADPRPGFEGKTQLRQTGISAVDAPGAGQELMDNAVARIKGNDSFSRIISDYPDRRSPDNEGHWNKLNRRGHNVQSEPSTDSFKQPWEDWMETPLDTKLNGGKSGQSYYIDNANHVEMNPGPSGFPEAKVVGRKNARK